MRSKMHNRMIWGIRFFLGLIYFTAGMSKLTHGNFPGLIGPVWLTDELEKYGLEYLGMFIAWSQTLIGLLLITQRFATLGAVMLVPMQLNIFMAMFSLGIHYYNPNQVNAAVNTSYINAVLFLMNIVLLKHDFQKLKFIFSDSNPELKGISVQRKNRNADLIVITGTLVCLISPLFYSAARNAVYFICSSGFIICISAYIMARKKII